MTPPSPPPAPGNPSSPPPSPSFPPSSPPASPSPPPPGPPAAVCKDTDANCKGWADSGECTANPTFMQASCKYSCGGCSSCIDQNDGCSGWATSGECEQNPSFMKASCKKSCGICGGAGIQNPGVGQGAGGIGVLAAARTCYPACWVVLTLIAVLSRSYS